ncbi:cysteine and tyrosine-rich protein 1-like [Ruditapes philippinarum]|uniref:cysteine and tyrosine-rich protein 1-like n=1 Tax=Ruditapes philippinarum TaxID=129788 RepID=UPI00295B58FC|nr:cysteine and tyrosine-rich protein 1-like [Ruditapes philippinarum]
MSSLECISKQIGILLILAYVVNAGEYCYTQDSHDVTEEYCDGYCCSSEDDGCCSDWGWIAGVVVGCIVLLAIVGTIVFLVCQKMNTKKQRTVNVQMSNNYQSNYRNNTRRQNNLNNQNMIYTTNMSGNNTLPPPPPYSQVYTAPAPAYNMNPAYPAPPPYPGSPLPGSNAYPVGNNGFQQSQTHMTSHAQNTNDMAYPPPPVS